MRFVALPLLASEVTRDPLQIALVSFAEQLPWLLTALPAGALADRRDRRRILWITDALRTLLMAGLTVAVALHAVSIPLLVGAGFLLGCGQTVYNAGWAGLVPQLVAPELRHRANGRLQAGALITDTLIGSPLGAVLFAAAAALPFGVDTVSFALAAALVAFLPGDYRPERHDDRTAQDRGGVREGVRWLLARPLLRRLCLLAATANLVGLGLTALLVAYARQSLGLSGLGFALLTASFAVGGIAGAVVAPRAAGRLGSHRLLRLAMLGTVPAALGVGLAPDGAAAAAAIALYGLLNVAWTTTAVTTRQNLVPSGLLGRVTMAYQMLATGAGALGAVLAGLLAHATTLRTPFFAGAAVLLIAGLVPLPPPRDGSGSPDAPDTAGASGVMGTSAAPGTARAQATRDASQAGTASRASRTSEASGPRGHGASDALGVPGTSRASGIAGAPGSAGAARTSEG